MQNNNHQVFISYSSKDSNIAKHLVEKIENRGVSCWFAERDIPDGTVWATEIDNAIHAARIFVVIVSNNSISSKQVPKEIGLAVNSCQVIMPLRVDYVQLEGAFRYYLSDCQWTDITAEQNDKLDDVAETIKRIIDENQPTEGVSYTPVQINKPNLKKLIGIGIVFSCVLLAGILAWSSSKSSHDIHADNLAIQEPVLSQTADVESLFSGLQEAYSNLFNSESGEIDMGKAFDKYKNADIDRDGIEDTITINTRDDSFSGDILIHMSSTTDILYKGDSNLGCGSPSWIAPADIQWNDVDSDGVNEILIKQATGSTGGVITCGCVYDYANGEWTILEDPFKDLVEVVDIQMASDGIISLHDSGRKNGADKYHDYMGTRCIVEGSVLHESEKKKELAKEYWPYEYWTQDTSNYSEQDFTVTNQAIAELKEAVELSNTPDVNVSIGNVFYYERRNIYLKEVTFKDSQGDFLVSVFVDKYNNIIDITEY